MINGNVIRYKIEEQPHTPLLERLTKCRQTCPPAESLINLVAMDGIRRARDLIRCPARQDTAVFCHQIGMRQTNLPGEWAAFPNPHHPHSIELPTGYLVQDLRR